MEKSLSPSLGCDKFPCLIFHLEIKVPFFKRQFDTCYKLDFNSTKSMHNVMLLLPFASCTYRVVFAYYHFIMQFLSGSAI